MTRAEIVMLAVAITGETKAVIEARLAPDYPEPAKQAADVVGVVHLVKPGGAIERKQWRRDGATVPKGAKA